MRKLWTQLIAKNLVLKMDHVESNLLFYYCFLLSAKL